MRSCASGASSRTRKVYARRLFEWSHFRALIRPPSPEQLDQLPRFERAAPSNRVTLDTTPAGTRARVRDGNPGLWTYPARILRIVDGDTLDAVVDLSLGHRAFPRPRGIDAAELRTQAGRDAKAFVEAALADTPLVLISTWRTDSCGRYLATLPAPGLHARVSPPHPREGSEGTGRAAQVRFRRVAAMGVASLLPQVAIVVSYW